MSISRESTWKVLLALLVWATISIALPWRWCRSVYEIGLFVLAGSIFWRWRGEPSRFLDGVLLLIAPAVVGACQLALGVTVSRAATAEAMVAWMACFAAAFVARHALAHTMLRRRFLTGAAIAGAIAAAVCLLQLPLRGIALAGVVIPDFDLFAGPFQNRNTYASFIELTMPVAIWQAVTSRRASWFWWGVTAVMAASVVATGSRAGSLLILCELGILMLAQIRTRALFPLTGVVVAVMAAGWDTLGDRLSHDDWSSHRGDLYSSTATMIAERPVAGHGLGTFETAYPRFARFDMDRRVNHAHNDWLEWAAEGGVLMPACLLGFLGLVAWNARRHLWSWGIAFVLAHSLVDYPLQRPGMSGWFWAIGGAVLAAASVEKSDPRRGSSSATKKRRSSGHPKERRSPLLPESVESKDQSLATAER